MLADRIQYRGVIYANLFASPVSVSREQATKLYTSLATALFPKLKLEYTPAEEDVPFKIVMKEEGQGRRADSITLDISNGQLRLLIDQKWPDSLGVACKRADQVWSIYRETIPEGQVQLAEARLRAQLPIPRPSAKDYLAEQLMGKAQANLSSLGNVSFVGMSYQVSPELEHAVSPLEGAAREVKIEPLRQEEGFLYVEVMSNWGRLAVKMSLDRSGEAQIVPGPLELEPETPAPAKYIEEIRDYIAERICPFLEAET